MTARHTISTANATRIGGIAVSRDTGPRQPKLGFRAGLRTAFLRLGVSVREGVAYRRTKAFYRRTGATWTRALS